ncbi:hypothetical protein [Sanyastnella coralliicola]|uniref:hypothetical protein n=1 Tax=Sanyastnella coralliicola TaxID=3069118 RepID=UPI0027BA259C|nr:hypothetical protein [Longitalea sp. SCSIO 12813]
MKQTKYIMLSIVPLAIIAMVLSCGGRTAASEGPKKTVISQEFTYYWYQGKAELSSYKLTQARYGELREGEAMLIFVTEPFDNDKQVKSDMQDDNDLSVLKLNQTRKFMTGVYPYSIMTSSFTEIDTKSPESPVKVTNSSQEWCGHTWNQLNSQGNGYEFQLYSYFESEGDASGKLPGVLSEDGIWAMIRMNPSKLPLGPTEVIPALHHLRLRHIEAQAADAIGTLTTENGVSTYTLDYTKVDRKLVIHFNSSFPYVIEGWEEHFSSGWGASAETLVTQGERITTELLPYWMLNTTADSTYRATLGLDR